MVKDAFAKAQIEAKQIDKIGVTIGPGSFTGVRAVSYTHLDVYKRQL